jgi:hypothetical protein
VVSSPVSFSKGLGQRLVALIHPGFVGLMLSQLEALEDRVEKVVVTINPGINDVMDAHRSSMRDPVRCVR